MRLLRDKTTAKCRIRHQKLTLLCQAIPLRSERGGNQRRVDGAGRMQVTFDETDRIGGEAFHTQVGTLVKNALEGF